MIELNIPHSQQLDRFHVQDMDPHSPFHIRRRWRNRRPVVPQRRHRRTVPQRLYMWRRLRSSPVGQSTKGFLKVVRQQQQPKTERQSHAQPCTSKATDMRNGSTFIRLVGYGLLYCQFAMLAVFTVINSES